MEIALFLLIGLVSGVLAGLFGIGGGIVIVPLLMVASRMPIQKATGTSLAALLLPVGIFGVLEYYRGGRIDVRAASLVALGLVLGIWVGARFALTMAPRDLQRGFALLLVVTAARMWWKA